MSEKQNAQLKFVHILRLSPNMKRNKYQSASMTRHLQAILEC